MPDTDPAPAPVAADPPAPPAPAPPAAPTSAPTAPAAAPPSPPPPAPSGTTPAAPEGTPAAPTPQTFEEWLADPVNAGHVKALREENAGHRTGKKAAEDKAQAILAAVMQAAGLQPDGKPDPEKVIGELRTQHEQAQAELRQLRIDNALTGALGKHQADPTLTRALLTVDGTLGKLDPASADFPALLEAAVMAAVNANPALKVASQAPATPPPPPAAPPVSGGQFNGPGAPNGTAQLTREHLKSMRPEEIVQAQRDGKLDALLGRR